MKKEKSKLIATLIFFGIVTIIGMFIWPLIDICKFKQMDCFYTYSFWETLKKAIFSSLILSVVFYIVLKLFSKGEK